MTLTRDRIGKTNPQVPARAAEIVREYGPFAGADQIHGVTHDGRRVWAATGSKLVAFDPESGQLARTLDRAGDAGTAFDGTHLYQIAEARIDKIDPATGDVVASIPAPGHGGDSGLAWAEDSLWVGQYRDRKIYQIDPETGAILRTIESNRFVSPACSFVADNFAGSFVHLAARDAAFAVISRAPLDKIEPFKKRMGWTFSWLSSFGTAFNHDSQVTLDEKHTVYNYAPVPAQPEDRPRQGEREGLSVFLRDGDRLFHTYSTYQRGLDPLLNTYNFLDLTPLGRQEEDGIMRRLRPHDKYSEG